jgi:hypothetical protein
MLIAIIRLLNVEEPVSGGQMEKVAGRAAQVVVVASSRQGPLGYMRRKVVSLTSWAAMEEQAPIILNPMGGSEEEERAPRIMDMAEEEEDILVVVVVNGNPLAMAAVAAHTTRAHPKTMNPA